MGFYGRLTFLGRFIIMIIVMAALGCALYFTGVIQPELKPLDNPFATEHAPTTEAAAPTAE